MIEDPVRSRARLRLLQKAWHCAKHAEGSLRHFAIALGELVELKLNQVDLIRLLEAGVEMSQAEDGIGIRLEHPTWQGEQRVLRWGEAIIKQFQQPAAEQECVLAALEEQGWPQRIDDPLPRGGVRDPKQRRRDVIKNLNRHQRQRRLIFRADGTGEGILWQPV